MVFSRKPLAVDVQAHFLDHLQFTYFKLKMLFRGPLTVTSSGTGEDYLVEKCFPLQETVARWGRRLREPSSRCTEEK